MRILIKNCTLISMSKTREKLEEQIDILIEDENIIKIEKNINENVDKVIDATNKIVMPGLINTHAHLPMSVFRETVDGYKTQDWLEEKIWPKEDKMENEDIYNGTIASCLEMIKTGTTTINDMYFGSEEIVEAAKKAKVRLQTTRTIMGTTEEGLIRIKELEDIIEKYKNESKISFNFGIHGLYTTNIEYLRKFIQKAKELKLPIHMHFCENAKERKDIQEMYNVESPVDVIKQEFNGTQKILAHVVSINENEIEELDPKTTYISHCPISNLKLGCGVAKIKKMKEHGIVVSLGTDGQGSGSNLDMFETMKFAALLQKGINENPKDMQAYEVLEMATINGAKTLNLEKEIGSIEVRKKGRFNNFKFGYNFNNTNKQHFCTNCV